MSSRCTMAARGRALSPYYILKRDGTVETRSINNFAVARAVPGVDHIIDVRGLSLPLGAAMLRQDGTVVTVRRAEVTDNITYHVCANPPCASEWPQVPRPAGLHDVVQIATGSAHVLALRKDGTLVAWGADQLHQAEVPATLSGVVAVAANTTMSYALTGGGQIVSWGGRD